MSAGRPAEAATILATHQELFERHDDPADRLRRQWIEARIARAEGRLDDAEPQFAAVRNGWLSLQRPYDATLATLDGAELQLARGNWREVRRQAERLAAIFETRGMHREAVAALILFQQAAKDERLTAEFLARLRRYLLARPQRPPLPVRPRREPADDLTPRRGSLRTAPRQAQRRGLDARSKAALAGTVLVFPKNSR